MVSTPRVALLLGSLLLTSTQADALAMPLHIPEVSAQLTAPATVTATVTIFAGWSTVYLHQNSMVFETPLQLPPNKAETIIPKPWVVPPPRHSFEPSRETRSTPSPHTVASSSAPPETSQQSHQTTQAPVQTAESSKKRFNPNDVPTVELSSVSSALAPYECTEDNHCDSTKQKCNINQKAVCQRAVKACQCENLSASTPKPTSSGPLTPIFLKNKKSTEAKMPSGIVPPYPKVTDWIKEKKIELEEQHCHDPSSYPKESVIDGNELWADARDICEALKGEGKRVSVEYGGYGANGKGKNGSKQHFAIYWKENCEFKSKERMSYGMKVYDPFESGETIDGESWCTMLLVENWKNCARINQGKGGYRDVGCLRYFTGPGEKFDKGREVSIKHE